MNINVLQRFISIPEKADLITICLAVYRGAAGVLIKQTGFLEL